MYKVFLYINVYLSIKFLKKVIQFDRYNKIVRCYVKHFQQPFMEQYGFDSSSEEDYNECSDESDSDNLNEQILHFRDDDNDIFSEENFNDNKYIINYYFDSYPVPKFVIDSNLNYEINKKLINIKINIIHSINNLNLNYINQIYIITCLYCYKYKINQID
tara:strand:- start:9279 stop:9758 length:480 start_codon:yes stop_codon:yes gene_type:complete